MFRPRYDVMWRCAGCCDCRNAKWCGVHAAGDLGEDAMMIVNSVEHIWDTTTVAVGDTAVLHCSFDALFQQLPHGNVRQSSVVSIHNSSI